MEDSLSPCFYPTVWESGSEVQTLDQGWERRLWRPGLEGKPGRKFIHLWQGSPCILRTGPPHSLLYFCLFCLQLRSFCSTSFFTAAWRASSSEPSRWCCSPSASSSPPIRTEWPHQVERMWICSVFFWRWKEGHFFNWYNTPANNSGIIWAHSSEHLSCGGKASLGRKEGDCVSCSQLSCLHCRQCCWGCRHLTFPALLGGKRALVLCPVWCSPALWLLIRVLLSSSLIPKGLVSGLVRGLSSSHTNFSLAWGDYDSD